ncbi:MAG: phosphoadenosine phosphosulfate reductase family protein [Thermoplasmata archaeon]
MVKVSKARKVIRQALRKWRCGVAFSGGKDSTVLLHLVGQEDDTVPVLFTDTSVKFAQTYRFIEDLQARWDFPLHTIRTEWEEEIWKNDKAECCYRLKVEPFNRLLSDLDLQAVFVGIRRDEHPARAKADYFDHLGAVTHISEVAWDHWRVHPLLDWSEEDIWEYTRKEELPANPLYAEGYRSIGCEPCTALAPEGERSGREHDKELVMDRLRRLGYF